MDRCAQTAEMEVDQMVGQVIRAVQAPISLSLAVARRGVSLAGQVTGWAISGIVRELSPGTRPDGPERAATVDEGPLTEPAAVASPELAETGPPEPAALMGEDVVSAPAEAAPAVHSEVQAAPSDGAQTKAAPAGGEQAAATSPDGDAAGAPPIGGEDGAVVEHEPEIGTSVRARDPHSALNNPVTEPDLTEWPDPYDHREDPRDPGEEMVFGGEAGHTQTGAISTSEPHPSQDPEAEPAEGPKRDKVDQ